MPPVEHEQSPLLQNTSLRFKEGDRGVTGEHIHGRCSPRWVGILLVTVLAVVAAFSAFLLLLVPTFRRNYIRQHADEMVRHCSVERYSFRQSQKCKNEINSRISSNPPHCLNHDDGDYISVAFLGNSLVYFNDLPRFMEAFSRGRIVQDSCLRGGSSIAGLAQNSNSMKPKYQTQNAILKVSDRSADQNCPRFYTFHDYGACTIQQLLVGGSGVPESWKETNHTIDNDVCHTDHLYAAYAAKYYGELNHSQTWDYVVINDGSLTPTHNNEIHRQLRSLKRDYLPLLQATGAIPVLLWTHAYEPWQPLEYRLESIPNFTSILGDGYKMYAHLLGKHLPKGQKPRVAPFGPAFLRVYQENELMWHSLFSSSDHIHPSPAGTFLEGCVLYSTLFLQLPPKEWVLRPDMSFFWEHARMMQHAWETPQPMVNESDASYLYSVCERVMSNYLSSCS